MSIPQNNYFSNLLKTSKSSKKQIAVYLDEATIERIDMTIRLFSAVSEAKSFSRNTLIEEAINKFLAESDEFLRQEMGLSVDEEIEAIKRLKNNTVILSSADRGFEETFLGEIEAPCWYPCTCSADRIPNLMYIAIYRGAPISAITHYAKVKEIIEDPGKGKVCYFDGEPIELPRKIGLGNKPNCFFRGAKYTCIESLLNATTADDISFG